MKTVVQDHALDAMYEGEHIVVPKLEFLECPNCGRTHFPNAAYDRICEALMPVNSVKL